MSALDVAKEVARDTDADHRDAAPQHDAKPKIGLWPLIAYALPAASTSLMIVPLTAVLPSLYNKYYGIPFETIG
jgi:hypothetical protein